MCGPHQVWPLRSECCGRGVPTKVVCAECMKMCCLGGKNSVVKGLKHSTANCKFESHAPLPWEPRGCKAVGPGVLVSISIQLLLENGQTCCSIIMYSHSLSESYVDKWGPPQSTPPPGPY